MEPLRGSIVRAMAAAHEIEQVAAGIFIWQVYDPRVKADLFSTGLETSTATYLVDPVDVKAQALRTLEMRLKIAGVIVTNENHHRAASQFAARFSVPIYVHQAVGRGGSSHRRRELRDGDVIESGLTAVAIDGGPAGEMALHYVEAGGIIVVGDALIHFEPYGFDLLPAKYCRDFERMRQSLSKLLDHSFERMFFAHGTPILSHARERLKQLLDAKR